MKLIDNWQNAYKSFSVLLPFIATTVALLISIITGLDTSGVISIDSNIYWGYALTALTWLGRIIPQVGLFIKVESEKEN